MKSKKNLFWLPFLLMGTVLFFTTGCSDDDDVQPYSMETMEGTFENVAERIEVKLVADGSAVLTKVAGGVGRPGEVDANATWEIANYETPPGVPGDNPLSIIIDHTNSEFDEPYVLVIDSQDELYDHWQVRLFRVEDNGDDNGDASDFQFGPQPHDDYIDMQLGMVSGGAVGELDNHPTYVFNADGWADYYENGEMVTGTEDTPQGFPWKFEDGKLIVASFAGRPIPTIELTEQNDGTFTSQKFSDDPVAVWEVDAGATDPDDLGGNYTMENLAGKWYLDYIGNTVWYQFNSDGTYVGYASGTGGDWELDGTTITMSGDWTYTLVVKEENDEVILHREGTTDKFYSEDAAVNNSDD